MLEYIGQSNNYFTQQIYNKNPYPSLVRLLVHSNIEIVIRIIRSNLSILLAGTSTTLETLPHSHFKSLQACDGIKKAYSLFQQNRHKITKDRAAICIGQLFRAQEITNKQMRNDIIKHLKTLGNDSDKWTKNAAKVFLRELAQNTADIEAGGFVIPE
ncbi:MAG: hypothetical protein EZS28_030012 [Streblomastix strix]|uniref:Uncharacterized protein n=1 Tax=Streblomastix strix TaxID=222440 RepID=A0A5J4UWC0_9EUKA|nr:MAG: hypothetical protein EZS28_030012 [Streblomastix strix]